MFNSDDPVATEWEDDDIFHNEDSDDEGDSLGKEEQPRKPSRAEQRASALGFRPQKELVYNSLLHCSELLDEESNEAFARIKLNLGRAVAMREFRPGFAAWSPRLLKFIKHYGFKFSKEDHVSLIKMYLSVLSIPELEPWIVNKAANAIITLTKTRQLLKREDLTVQWRPLYDVYKRCCHSSLHAYLMVFAPAGLENALKSVIRCCRCYFPDGSTEEMLEEWRPLMCPFDAEMGRAMMLLELFLPTFNCFQRRETTYLLWFDELMTFWKACNNPAWERHLFNLYSRLAVHNLGRIDWQPHIPFIFTRIQASFGLPVSYKNALAVMPNPNASAHARWVVALLGNQPEAKRHLDYMLNAVESYLHPANSGHHASELSHFIFRLCRTFVCRLRDERHVAKPSWGCGIDDAFKLIDSDVDAFVDVVLPLPLITMYSRAHFIESSSAFKFLVSLRPAKVIPPLLERFYASLDTVTEPHKLKSAVSAITCIARTLVSPEGFPEGPTHVIPLMMSILPGIDFNDLPKCVAACRMLATFCSLVPIIDCSESLSLHADELSEEEKLICGQSVQMEDLVLGFLDRCFAIVESSGYTQTRQDATGHDPKAWRGEEAALASQLSLAFVRMIEQASDCIYDAALRKVANFVVGSIFETKVSGQILSSLCHMLVLVNPRKGLAAFIPEPVRILKHYLDNDANLDSQQNLDGEIKFNMMLVATALNLLQADVEVVEPYLEDLKHVLRKTLRVSDLEVAWFSRSILCNLLKSLQLVYIEDGGILHDERYKPLSEYHPYRMWGRSCRPWDVSVDWKEPSDRSMDTAQSIVDEFLGAELNALKEFSRETRKMTKEEVTARLQVVLTVLKGASGVLPFWDETLGGTVNIEPVASSFTDFRPLSFRTRVSVRTLTLRGENARLSIIRVADELQKTLLDSSEDDTKSLNALIGLFDAVLLLGEVTRREHNLQLNSANLNKKLLENPLIGRSSHTREMHLDRAYLRYQERAMESIWQPLTATHAAVLKNVLALATSRYSSVRSYAQGTVTRCVSNFLYSYTLIVPELVSILRNPKAKHEEFKGALYVLLGHKWRTLLVKQSWSMLRSIWPALIASRHSEKPSVGKLMYSIRNSILQNVVTFALKVDVPDSVVASARALAPIVSEDDVRRGTERAEEASRRNLSDYEEMLDEICDLVEAKELHARHVALSHAMFHVTIRPDHRTPPRVARIVVGNLLDDAVTVRNNSMPMVSAILKQQKRQHPKKAIDVEKAPELVSKKVGGTQSSEPERSEGPTDGAGLVVRPGERPDNAWLLYDASERPDDEEKWKRRRFVHKNHPGYYAWPKPMLVYAPQDQQPKLDRDPEEMTPTEREIFAFFVDQSKVDRLLFYLSMEGKKGSDRFSTQRFALFKGLFRNFGRRAVGCFEERLRSLVEDENESSQRCAAEILSGLLRGTKHWPFEDVRWACESMVVPLVRDVFLRISQECLQDWGTCFATAFGCRDLYQMHWVFEALADDPIRCRGSFEDVARMYCLQGVLVSRQWRVGEMSNRIVTHFQPFLSHPYKNVRDRLSSVLSTIYNQDVNFGPGEPSLPKGQKGLPKVNEFLDSVLPELDSLASEGMTEDAKPIVAANGFKTAAIEEQEEEEDPRKGSFRLLQVVTQLMTSLLIRFHGARSGYFRLLPVLCANESNKIMDVDNCCHGALSSLAQTVVPEAGIIDACLDAVEKVEASPSSTWKAKAAALEFFQAFVFTNMPSMLSREIWRKRVVAIVQARLVDHSLEVRIKAGSVLSGLLHTSFLDEVASEKLKKTFQNRVIKNKSKKTTGDGGRSNDNAKSAILRHSGILGLCAFVDAYPYDVPEFVPDVLMFLSDYLHDVQPTPVTIKKTLQNFKRTHQDNWQAHKLKFSNDQLAVLTDLLISPSYYA